MANLCTQTGSFLRTRRAWAKNVLGLRPDPLFLPRTQGPRPPRFFQLELPLLSARGYAGYRSKCSQFLPRWPPEFLDTGKKINGEGVVVNLQRGKERGKFFSVYATTFTTQATPLILPPHGSRKFPLQSISCKPQS